MIKYRTRFDKIEAVEIEKETEKQVVIRSISNGKTHRENKRSDWSNWHGSWEQAHAFLIDIAEQQVMHARHALSLAERRLESIKSMQRPS